MLYSVKLTDNSLKKKYWDSLLQGKYIIQPSMGKGLYIYNNDT